MKHILYVDDEIEMLDAVKKALEHHGFLVTTASDGPRALEILPSNIPDIIIIDLRMEPMNGFELFEHIRKIPALKSIPIFILTALKDPLTQKYSETLGVDAFITKPFDVDELAELITKRLSSNDMKTG